MPTLIIVIVKTMIRLQIYHFAHQMITQPLTYT